MTTAHIKSLSHISHGMHDYAWSGARWSSKKSTLHPNASRCRVPGFSAEGWWPNRCPQRGGRNQSRCRRLWRSIPTPLQFSSIVFSISMCFGLTRLSFAIENQTDKAPVLVYWLGTSAETSTTIQSHLSGQQMNFWTRGFPKTRTSRACSANVQHTSTDTDWVNTSANRTFKHSVEIIWNANDACYSTRRPFQIQSLANWGMDIDWLAVPWNRFQTIFQHSSLCLQRCHMLPCCCSHVCACVCVCVCVFFDVNVWMLVWICGNYIRFRKMLIVDEVQECN